MTRRDYIKLAAALARTQPTLADHTTTSAVGNNTMTNHISYEAAYFAWRAARDAIADVLADDSPNFQYVRFNTATEK